MIPFLECDINSYLKMTLSISKTILWRSFQSWRHNFSFSVKFLRSRLTNIKIKMLLELISLFSSRTKNIKTELYFETLFPQNEKIIMTSRLKCMLKYNFPYIRYYYYVRFRPHGMQTESPIQILLDLPRMMQSADWLKLIHTSVL